MGKMLSELTDMQQLFVDNYLVTLNAKKSAIAAGYSPDSASDLGHQLLKHPLVSKQLRKAMSRRAKRLELSADNILREIARVAFSDIRAVMSFDANGVKVKSSDKIHSDAAAAIQSVEHKLSETKDNCNISVKVKMHDKMKALDMAGRHLGLWKEADLDDKYKNMTVKELMEFIAEKSK